MSFEHHSSFHWIFKKCKKRQRLSCISDTFVVNICFVKGTRYSNKCLYVLKQHMRYLSAFLSLTARKCKVIWNISSQFLEISLFFHRKHFQLKVALKKTLQNQSFQSWKLQTQYSTGIQGENKTEKHSSIQHTVKLAIVSSFLKKLQIWSSRQQSECKSKLAVF